MNTDHTLARILSNASTQTRGYADYWEWEADRGRAELGVAEALCEFLKEAGELSDGQLSRVHPDPPDILFTETDGQRIGIEVTELVDPRAAALNRQTAKHQQGGCWALWTPATVAL